MLIKQLVLRNFRVFSGTHTIDLAPRKRQHEIHDRPIVLFGGLNGAGKTSILSAIRLSLYGRLAFNHTIQQQEYIEQLSALIHNGNSQSERPEEASIELTFTYNKEGKESEFTVTRSWKRGKKDLLSLQQDGQTLSELNYEQCQGFLNELIPNGVADLFFFDGEKIAELAEDESGNILRTAMRRLLGLDLISKLRNDLIIYIKRQQSTQLEGNLQQHLSELEVKSKEIMCKTEAYLEEADFLKARIDLLTRNIIQNEGLLSAQGGSFAQTKEQEQKKVDELIKEKERIEKALRHEFDGTLPYALAPKTLSLLLEKISQESEIKQAKSFEKELSNFLNMLKSDLALRSSTTSKIATEAITDNLNEYMANKPKGELLFDISDREVGMLQQSIEQDSQKSWERFDEYRIQLTNIEQQLEQSAANIARAPDNEQLMDIFQKIRELDKERNDIRKKYITVLEEALKCKQQQLDCARQIQKLHDSARNKYGLISALKHAEETIKLLETYSEVLTQARVKKLTKNLEEAYQKLARKEDLQLHAHINPETFDVELIDENQSIINRKSLSAGEKQIYAIAILEALAKTSGQELPVIIDTPLGRLDSKHRDNLINYYFPYASHQVVLLSTDTEVDERYFVDQLRDDISHTYQIVFNAKTKSSSLKSGYFWELTKETV
ncbi:DNA sulfur modification protein DndD [Xenorhabdus siamensis]|uniref:DNA sulfur modification protein DndD n=1 Tax=Xenorhabdus siamensis TaxID=3136254 RepID=UPI0030F4699D